MKHWETQTGMALCRNNDHEATYTRKKEEVTCRACSEVMLHYSIPIRAKWIKEQSDE